MPEALTAAGGGAGFELRVEEISWNSEPLPRAEDLPVGDLLSLSVDELQMFAANSQQDLRAVRELLRITQDALVHVLRQRDRALSILRRQRARRVAVANP